MSDTESERDVMTDDEDEVPETAEEQTRGNVVNQSRKATARGYRKYANAAGIDNHFATTIVKTCYSTQDAKRFARWAPAQAGSGLSAEALAKHLRCASSELSTPAAQVMLPAIESLARKVMTDATMRAFEDGKTRISAAHVRSAIRPYKALNEDLVMPLCVVRAAQRTKNSAEEPVLKISGEDEASFDSEKRFMKEVLGQMIKQSEVAQKEAKANKKKKSNKRPREEPVALAVEV